MKVDLIDYTRFPSQWGAADLMIWTKRTRVEMTPGGLDEIAAWPEDKKLQELEYMAATIPSSWEFCDYTFLLRQVSRSLTHQLVRHRHMSFAQQTMQILDLSGGWDYHTGPTVKGEAREIYQEHMKQTASAYAALIRMGVKIEDARNLLPMGIYTNIVVKANLRTLCDFIRKRVSPRNLQEIDVLAHSMKATVLSAHPWSELFLCREADSVATEMYNMISSIPEPQLKVDLTKRVDQLLTQLGVV